MSKPNPIDRPAGTAGDAGQRPVELIRLRGPRDLPVVVPHLLGFHPDPGSVVVLALHAGRVAVTLRVNAPSPDGAPAMWARLAEPLADAGTDDLAIVGYLPADHEPRLLAFAAGSPLPPFEVIRVHDGRWWSLTCPNGPECCPPGEPLTADPAVAAPLVAFTGAPAGSRADLAACLQPGSAELVDAVGVLLPLDPLPPAQALFAAVVDARTQRADGPVPVPPGQAALLLQALQDLRIRDLCCGWFDDPAAQLWTDLIRVAPRGQAPPVATLIATTAYQRGNTALAQIAVEHALGIDPSYGLARLLHAALRACLPPQAVRDTLAGALIEIARQPTYGDLLAAGPDTPGRTRPVGGEGRG